MILSPLRSRLRLTWLSMLGCGILGIMAGSAWAQTSVANEAAIKAMFVYNFARFVDWPPETFTGASAPLRIQVIGRDPFEGYLDQVVAGKKINGHPITVAYSLEATALPSGHIVVISASETKRLSRLLESCRQKAILTVSDARGFVESGGIIDFVAGTHRLGFGVNVATAHDARLRIDSKLLAIAQLIIRHPAATS